jgi:DNA-binding response OmpR family regulator
MNDYLSKPFEVAQLLAMLKRWLGSNPQGRTGFPLQCLTGGT